MFCTIIVDDVQKWTVCASKWIPLPVEYSPQVRTGEEEGVEALGARSGDQPALRAVQQASHER